MLTCYIFNINALVLYIQMGKKLTLFIRGDLYGFGIAAVRHETGSSVLATMIAVAEHGC